MAGAELARSATEQPHVDMDHKHRIATERSLADGHMLDPEIVLRKDPEKARSAVRIKDHHPRAPDVGIGILISMPSYGAGGEAPEMIEYRGEYIGHGQSKTAFELHCQGARFHGEVLKVARAQDMEPSVFMEAMHIKELYRRRF